jgi:hypothetical protein
LRFVHRSMARTIWGFSPFAMSHDVSECLKV